MEFKFRFGTIIYFGKDCLKKNQVELTTIGKRAFIVTGKNSGRLSGALADVTEILKENSIEYKIFNNIKNNPTVENVEDAAKSAKDFGSDFIIGIGGGSPLDASKAVAVLCTNDIKAKDLFVNKFENKMLPVVCIPTTAGTGSEATPYSILTKNDINSKKSFGNDETFPTISFLDPTYTKSMSYELAINTAVDTLSHAVEGYITKRSTPLSDVFAIEVMKIFGESAPLLLENNLDFDLREKLLYMSLLGGIEIAQSGTTIVHGMGYSLTYFKDIPHGKANGFLLKEFLKFNYSEAKDKIDNALRIMGKTSIDEFGEMLDSLFKEKLTLSEEEILKFSEITMKQPSISTNVKNVELKDIEHIYRKSAKE